MSYHANLPLDFEQLLTKSQSGKLLSQAEKDFLTVHLLVQFYNYLGPITAQFLLSFNTQNMKKIWFNSVYSLSHPFQDKLVSSRHQREILQLLNALDSQKSLASQAFLLNGNITLEKRIAARQIIENLGFDNYWCLTGLSSDDLVAHLTKNRLYLHQLLLRIIPSQKDKIYTINQIWNALNAAIHKVLGCKI